MRLALSPRATETRRSVGAAIRAARIAAGLSQRTVASRLGLTSAMLCMVESGARACPPARAHQIAEALTMPPEHLTRPPDFARSDDESEWLAAFRHLPDETRAALLDLARSDCGQTTGCS